MRIGVGDDEAGLLPDSALYETVSLRAHADDDVPGEDGALEVHTRIDSLSDERKPIAIGFHPYFQLTDSPREEWRIAIGAKTHWKLEPSKLPTGETEPITQFLPDPKHVLVKDVMLDDIHRPRTR